MPMLLDLATGQLEAPISDPDMELTHDTDVLSEDLDLTSVKVLSVELPKFKDGRAFTQVRVLRDRLGFEGEIRVIGHVIPDQAQMLARVGASTVLVQDEARAEDFRVALKAFRFAYQRSAIEKPAFSLRGGAA